MVRAIIQGARLPVKTFAVSLLSLTAATSAWGADWTPIATFPDGTSLSVDTASISSSGRYRKGWFKLVALQPAALPDNAVPNTNVPPGQGFKYIVEQFYAKCTKPRVALIQGSFYGADDSLLGTLPTVPVRSSEFEEVPPGSVGDRIIRSLCKSK